MSVDALKQPNKRMTHTSDFLDYALEHSFGDLHFKVDPATGMKAIIAIHNTTRGPALGGCRFIEYTNTNTAINDAMRLARGMSFKSALADLPLGGGKAVIIKPARSFDRAAYMRQFGRFVHELNGRYITALDSGTQLADMDIIAQHTPYVASLSSDNGDPSPSTAQGVLRGIQAAVRFQLGKDTLHGVHVAIQGLGHVGYALGQLLHDLGAQLTVADINPNVVEQAANQWGAATISTSDIHKVACDVFAPNALGAVLNDISIPQLQTRIIAGAANNQLAHTHHGQHLHDAGILYTPDYVINSGGVIFAAGKYLNLTEATVTQKIDGIKHVLLEIFERSRMENKPTSVIADALAREKLSIEG